MDELQEIYAQQEEILRILYTENRFLRMDEIFSRTKIAQIRVAVVVLDLYRLGYLEIEQVSNTEPKSNRYFFSLKLLRKVRDLQKRASTRRNPLAPAKLLLFFQFYFPYKTASPFQQSVLLTSCLTN